MSIPFKFNPLGISGKFRKSLRLTATQDSSSVTLTKTGSPNVSGLKYRLSSSDPWSTYTIDTTIDLNQNDYVEFCNVNSTLSLNSTNYVQFVMTGQISGSGNIQSLLNYSKNCYNSCFIRMFYGCSSLIKAPELPATTLASYCYSQMFRSCTSLSTAPELPATTLANYCYYAMFLGCSSLIEAPELPATTLADSCYEQMFLACASLTIVPELPVTTLANGCYRAMFNACTSLTIAPALPATTLANYCYNGMFTGCTSLTIVPELPATTLANYCYTQMFRSCTSLSTAPALPATTLADSCYYNMFNGCTSLRSAPNLPALTLTNNCYSSMFEGCTGLIVGPTMNATTLATNSCVTMFSGCSLLQSIIIKFSDWGDSSATNNWMYNVAQIGTFTKPGGLPESRGASYIPTGWTIANSYKRDLAYIESTGTQYINTGIKPDFANGDSIEIKFYKGEADGGICFLGSRQLPGPVNGLYVLGTGIVCCDNSTFTSITFVNRGTFTLTVDDNYVKINDTQNTMPLRVSCSYDMFLFALNNGGNALSYATDMKLYEWKYYQNGVLKQWLIPVMNNDDVPCLYDKINGTFKYNAGTGAFNYGELPYTKKLAYIESTGTQYIDTGVKPNFPNNDEIYISFYGAEYSGASPAIFGSRQSDLRNGAYGLGGNVTVLDADGYDSYAFDLVGYRWVNMDNSKVTSNGRNYEFALTRHPNCTYNIYLFALNSNGSPVAQYNGMKLYEWKYYQNGVLKQSLIPVLDSNSVPCLYDEVGGTLIYNAGTGQFNYGEING